MSELQLDKNSVIGFDLDGVIIDHTENKIMLAKAVGWNLTPQQTAGDVIKQIIPKAILIGIQQNLYDHPQVAFSAPLMLGAVSILSKIKKQNIPYFLISRRRIPELATLILKTHFLWPRFFNEANTFFVEKPEDKDKQAVKLGITHFVDDDISVLEKMPSVKNRILFDKHHSFSDSPFARVSSWAQLKKTFSLTKYKKVVKYQMYFERSKNGESLSDH